MRAPLTIMVAPNGARRTKADHPGLPLTQREIVDAVSGAQAAGAHAAHVHVRDETGQHVLDARRYLALTEALRARCGDDFIIQITTEAVGRYTPQEQRRLVQDVEPQAVSIAFRELFANPLDPAERRANAEFLAWSQDKQIAIQWIHYTAADVSALAAMIDEGVIPEATSLLFVLGRYSEGQQSSPSDLLPFLACQGQHACLQTAQWSVCAFGQAETACLTAALLLGGDVRVGFENSLWNADGSVADSNAQRVAEIMKTANALNVPMADPMVRLRQQ